MLQPGVFAATEARTAVEQLSDLLPAQRYLDLRIVVTELITNAVRFGPEQPIVLAIRIHPDGSLSGEVSDGGATGVHIDRDRPPEDGGMGLQIVDALAQSWGVRSRSTDVWFELGGSGR